MANPRNRVSSLPCILTSGRVLFSILTVFVLTVFVNAQDTVSRTNASGTVTGTDVATVQTADGAAEGDVLTISGTSTHNSLVAPVRTFTVQSANSTAQTINAGTAGCYNLAESGAYTITLSNLNYQGNSTAVANDGGFMYINNSGAAPALTLNNVSFSGFKLDNKHGGVICVNQGSLTINSTGTLSFSNNNAAGSDGRGAAIYGYTGSTQNNVSISGETIDFSNNTATIGGGAVARTNLTLTGSTITFNNNRANNNDGGAFHSGKLTITGIDKNSSTTFEGNSANYIGGAVSATDVTLSTGSFYFINNTGRTFHTNGRAGAVSAGSSFTATDVETLSFTGNKSASICGALASGGNISISAKNVTFEKNKTTAGTTNNTDYGMGGGILADGGNLTITADTISFKENEATHRGGAIRANGGNVTIDGNTISFSGNKAGKYGAAIRVESSKALNITGTTITFENNVVSGNDGGAISGSNLTITGKSADAVTTFKNNSAKYIGGAIGASSMTFKTGNFYFQNNKATTYHDNATGGGISTGGAIKFSDANIISFTNNTGTRLGGAVYAGSLEISGKSITFTGNKAAASGYTNGQGGAIYCTGSVTFSGENVVAEFNNNSATNAGNDLYLSGSGGLTFQDNGTYSFDGGIYMNNSNKPATVINQAQVTIAGRANDSTNKYQFHNVNISNGGSLTANLDYIDSLTGTFNVGTADTAGTLELNVGSGVSKLLDASSFKIYSTDKGVVKKTGEGTLRIYTASEGLIEADSFVVSSGRLDMQKYFKGALTVGEKLDSENYSTAIFSPGNSVGSLDITGDFTLNPGSTLLMEINGADAESNDQLIVDGTTLYQDNSLIQFALAPDSTYFPALGDEIQVKMPEIDDWSKVSFSSYYFTLKGYEGGNVILGVNPNAVPEPSTWALLALGVCGLLYLRKRK